MKKTYTVVVDNQPYHVMFLDLSDGTMHLSFAARPEISVKVKPEDVNVDMGPFAFQLEPYARVLCARLELEK